MSVLRLFIFVLLLLLNLNVRSQTLGIKGESATSIGIYIQEISSGRVVASRNSELALVPASILKSFTSATALCMLGPETVPFVTDASLSGERRADSWYGNIEISACGDPTLDSRHFPENATFASGVADAIVALGIKRIYGQINVHSPDGYPGVLPTWEVEDVGWDYGAGIWGFNWKDNTFTFSPSDAVTDPWVPDFRFVILPAAGVTQFLKGIGSDSLTIYTNKAYKPGQRLSTTMSNPAAVFSDNLRMMLVERGVEVVTAPEHNSAAVETVKILTHSSPPVKEILKSLMHRSDNMMAEGMLRRLEDVTSDIDSAISIECAFWEKVGLSPEFSTIRDGSGLSRGNRIRPSYLGAVLRYMALSKLSGDYVGLFPVCGREGTVKSFLASTPLAGRMVLKSGSMSGVHCYAGYKLDAAGKPTHVVVMMVNGFFCQRTELRKALERYLLNVFSK